MILVICAVLAELRDFERPDVDVIAVGVGPVEAAIGATRALGANYTCVVNAGIGGGFRAMASVGDAVAVTHDSYVELGREDRGALALPGGLQLASTAVPDRALLDHMRAHAPAVRLGPAITSATITTSAVRADMLAARFAPVVESMEGFAVLRAAALTGTPAIELRGISNLVGDRAESQWNFRAGSAAAVRALTVFLDSLDVKESA